MKNIFTLSILLIAGITSAQLPGLHWSGSFGSTGDETATGMAAAPDGSLYVTGNFAGTVDFDPGPGVTSLTAGGLYTDIFIQKFDIAGNLLWVKKINNGTNSSGPQCVIDNQGNILVTGAFRDTADLDPGTGTANFTATYYFDSFIIKLDSDGNYIWGKNIATAGDNSEWITAIKLDDAGNIYTAGYFYGTITIGGTVFTSNGAYDSFIQKMDAAGNTIWVKTLGGSSYDGVFAMEVSTDGSLYLTGVYGETVDFNPGSETFSLTGQGVYDGFILKLDNNGGFAWVKSIGGANIDVITDLKLDADGNLIVAGSYASHTLTFSVNGASETITKSGTSEQFADVLLFKMDSSGNYLWVKHYGSTGDDSAASVAVDETGKIYVLGIFNEHVDFDPGAEENTQASAGLYDIFLQCLTTDGDYVYAHKIGGSGLDQARRVVYNNGALYITAIYKNTVNLNPAGGAVVSATSVGGDDYFICKFGTETLSRSAYTNTNAFTLYPNPTTGHFTLQGEGIENAQVTVYDAMGKVAGRYEGMDGLATPVLAVGIYFVEIIANGKREVKKLVVK